MQTSAQQAAWSLGDDNTARTRGLAAQHDGQAHGTVWTESHTARTCGMDTQHGQAD